MSASLLGVIVSGILVMIASLAGVVTQSVLQRKREAEKTLLELRIENFGQVCAAISLLVEVFRDAIVDVKEQKTTEDPPTVYTVVPKASLQEVRKMVGDIHIAVAKASLVASNALAAELLSFAGLCSIILSHMEKAQDPAKFKTEYNGFDMVMWVSEVALGSMKVELGVAKPTDWNRAHRTLEERG